MKVALEELREERLGLVRSLFRSRLEDPFEERLSELMDQYFRRAIEESPAGRRLFKAGKAFSFVAVGGYGRKELCVCSDVDLMILFLRGIPEQAKDLIRETLFPLWDLGLEIGYSVRTIKDCVQLSRRDFEVLTSLLDARFIGGDSQLFLRLLERMEGKVLGADRELLARWLRDGFELRKEAFGDASHLLEPDLKKGAGGLRDFHHVLWLAKAESRLTNPRDLEYHGRLSHKEYQDLERRLGFVRLVRNHLHHICGRKNDRLYFEYQKEIAGRLGYRDSGGHQAVEQFMGDLHAAMAAIKTLTRPFLSGRPGNSAIPDAGGAACREGVYSHGGEVHFYSATAILADPMLLVIIFQESARLGEPLSLEAVRLVREFLHLVDEPFRSHPGAMEGLIGLLEAPWGSPALDQMFDSGLLCALVPELEEVKDRVQFDTYHIYPVARHSLETVRLLKETGRHNELLLSSIYLELQDPGSLLLAALFHDVGKVGANHAARGAALVKKVLARMRMERRRAAEVVFLVRYHLLMVETATRRDLNDEKMIVGCARTIGTVERLKRLYLLTWADAGATGPRAWSEWTASLVQELFFKVMHVLEKGELATRDASKRAARSRREAARLISKEGGPECVDKWFEVMPPRYLLNTPPREIVRHLRLVERLGEPSEREAGAFILEAREDEASGCWEITLAAGDRPGLFCDMAGVLALHNLNILSSDIYTWRNGTAVDVFRVDGPGEGKDPDETWERVKHDLEKVLKGDLSLDAELGTKASPSILSRPGRPVRPPRVKVDNASSDFFTIVEVFTHDRVGLLYDITRTFSGAGLDIRLARIATKGDQVADVFYVCDLEGRKLEETREEILSRALFTLLG
ncbi:MAG: [protein-PII] uridylyltransferase [Desulfobacteraceae bacterium]